MVGNFKLRDNVKMEPASSKAVKILSSEIIDSAGRVVHGVNPSDSYVIAITVEASRPAKNVSIGYNIKLANGVTIYGTSSAIQGELYSLKAEEIKTARFSFKPNLTLGTYYLSAGAAEALTPEDEIQNYVMLDFIHDAAPFVVVAQPESSLSKMEVRLVSFEREEGR